VCGNKSGRVTARRRKPATSRNRTALYSRLMHGEQKVRSGAIDVVRVIGIVAVVAGHMSTEGPIRPLLYTWHVPLFFVLVGYFWSPRRSFRVEFMNRFRTLIIPTLVWGTAIYIIYSAATAIGGEFTGEIPVPAYMAYWFAPALFFSALLYRALTPLPTWIGWGLASAGLALTYLASDVMTSFPLYIGLALPGLFFVLVGRTTRRLRRYLRLVFVLPAFMAAVVLVALNVSRSIDVKSGDLGTPILSVAVAAIISITLIVACETLIPKLPAVVSLVATNLALSGWAVVLGHAAFIFALRDADLPPALVFAGGLSLPWLIGLIALRTRFSPLLTGSPRLAKGTAAEGAERPARI
jgi:acyltransferase